MALKPYRRVLDTCIDFFTDAVMERGGVVVLKTGGSGSAEDQGEAVIAYQANPSGYAPLGVLLQEVVDKDLTQTHLNFFKDEVQVGSKAAVMTKGVVVTDMIYPGLTVNAGDSAFLIGSGLLSTNQSTSPNSTPEVGVFLSSKDENGYAKVSINLPTGQPL